MSEGIPYKIPVLAEELGFDAGFVRRGMVTFRRLGMIDGDTKYPHISGWEDNQNVEGLEKMKEQNRTRQKKWYETEKKKDKFKEIEEINKQFLNDFMSKSSEKTAETR